jgi:hypothetical protein
MYVMLLMIVYFQLSLGGMHAICMLIQPITTICMTAQLVAVTATSVALADISVNVTATISASVMSVNSCCKSSVFTSSILMIELFYCTKLIVQTVCCASRVAVDDDQLQCTCATQTSHFKTANTFIQLASAYTIASYTKAVI